MQGRKQYQEKLFTTFRLSDHIPESNFYRRLNNLLDLRFLYKATEKYYGKEGNPGLDPVVFFKLLLTGYFQNLQSDRSIIENARLRLDILFFIGYDIDEELPWHSTLSRTRQLFGEDIFQMLFKEVLKQCVEKGMVAGNRQAIDSVLVKANVSMDSLKTLSILQDGGEYLSSLVEDDDNNEVDKTEGKGKSNSSRHSSTDPDARIATKPGKPRQMNYLGQVSVDTANHVITNIEAHHADKRDSECFEDVLNRTVENLKENGLKIKEVLADTNYSSSEALKAAIKNNIEAYIPNMGQYKTERPGFKYVVEGDYYQCDQGVKLSFKALRTSREKNLMRDYRSPTEDCRNCSLKSTCLGKTQSYKTISHSQEKPLYDQINERMQTSYAKKLRRLRQSTAEPVIGTLVNFLAMKRIRTIGIQQANKYLIGAAVAYNIKKWMKWQNKNPKIVAIVLPIPEKSKITPFFSTCFQQIAAQANDFLFKILNPLKFQPNYCLQIHF